MISEPHLQCSVEYCQRLGQVAFPIVIAVVAVDSERQPEGQSLIVLAYLHVHCGTTESRITCSGQWYGR
jgi:hypothetical protein